MSGGIISAVFMENNLILVKLHHVNSLCLCSFTSENISHTYSSGETGKINSQKFTAAQFEPAKSRK